MAKRNALGKVYELAWKHENKRVRLAALYLLCKGQVSVAHINEDDGRAIDALREAGCDERVNDYVFPTDHVFTCAGAKECYANGAFFEQE